MLRHVGSGHGVEAAPHTLEIAALWAVLTRLEEPKNQSLTTLQKLKLYNGKTLPGFTDYMQMIDETHLLTVGRNSPQGAFGPVQVTLFDVSDLTFRYDQLWRDNRFTGLDRIGDANQLFGARLPDPPTHQ